MKHTALTAGAFSLSIGSLALSIPSQAASVNTDTLGDVNLVNGQATLTNAYADGSDDPSAFNASGNNPESIDAVEAFLGITPGSLPNNPTEGSALRTIFTAQAGDVFSFSWNFRTNQDVASSFQDYAFVTINSSVLNLASISDALSPDNSGFSRQTGFSNFSHTFTTAGTYNIGIGVVDVDDSITSSALSVSDANYQTVPEPLTMLGSAVAMGFGVLRSLKRSKEGKTAN